MSSILTLCLPAYLLLASSSMTSSLTYIDLTMDDDEAEAIQGVIDLASRRPRQQHYGRPPSDDEDEAHARCPGCTSCLGWSSSNEAEEDDAYVPIRRARRRRRAQPVLLRPRGQGERLANLVQQPLPRTQECAICLADNSAAADAVQLPCGHWFHHACISEWSRTKCNCPKCRVSFRK